MKKILIGCFYLAAALVLGALLAALAANLPFLSWLAFGESIGISVESPMVIDLSVIKLAFGLEFGITIAHILCFIGAFFAYLYTIKSMRKNEVYENEE